ncbi:hypothetical protein [Cytobacillus sp. IB215665]|uniref:hypothetical protein n=1 Tax=Cytobacillus sp. IB215665 TaxID=3097357 RepID=UPI002A175480|nr:hypothetical protein [Cytobacillus sp. IB215665]MDX8364455.1 hypothetical protein [Cytobacillus sp. IB215665]
MEKEEQRSRGAETRPVDPFSRFLFGPPRDRNRQTQNFGEQQQPNVNQTPPQQNDEIDYVKIMEQLNDIYNSYNQLKPMMKELTPLFNFFKKSKK